MMFNWVDAICGLVIVGIPVSVIGFLFAGADDNGWLMAIFTVLLLILAFLGGGVVDCGVI